MGKIQSNQKLCGVLDIPQTEYNGEFCHVELNNSLSFSLYTPGAIPVLPGPSSDCPEQASGAGGQGTPLLLKKKLGN